EVLRRHPVVRGLRRLPLHLTPR
ncbi:MAG: hypothetical protein AVDCRST_MAG66-4022, partial [uncultured Pseudonocardia sp.]